MRGVPNWALHEVLDMLEDDKNGWKAAATLVCVSRQCRASISELLVHDLRAFEIRGKYGPNLGVARVVDVSEGQERVARLNCCSSRLRCVRIEHANLCGSLEPLRLAVNLRKLSLAGCDALELTLEPLRELVRLRYLNLSGCGRLEGDLEALSQLANLNALHLAWCQGLRGHIAPLGKLHRLRYLDLDWCIHLHGSLAEVFAADDLDLVTVSIHCAHRLSGSLQFRARCPRVQVSDV